MKFPYQTLPHACIRNGRPALFSRVCVAYIYTYTDDFFYDTSAGRERVVVMTVKSSTTCARNVKVYISFLSFVCVRACVFFFAGSRRLHAYNVFFVHCVLAHSARTHHEISHDATTITNLLEKIKRTARDKSCGRVNRPVRDNY